MVWLIPFALFFLFFLAMLIRYRIRETRYLKKSTRESMSPKLREAVEMEIKDAKRRKEKFNQTLKKFGF